MNKLNEKIVYDVVIIGGGAGGLFAATNASTLNLSSIILEKKSYVGGQPMELYPNKYIYDFPGFPKIKSSEIIKKIYDQTKSWENIKIELEVDINDIKLEVIDDIEYFLFETSKSSFYSRKIIIATGNGSFTPRKLDVNNVEVESKYIHYSLEFDHSIYTNKKIVVLGGGDSAVEWANYFVEENISNDVTIVHRRDKYRSNLSTIEELARNNVNQKLNYTVTAFDDNSKSLTITHNETSQTEVLQFDYVIVLYGQVPSPMNIKLFESIQKEKGKCVIDLNQKTSLKNVYAIGDATWFNSKPNTIVTACAEAVRAVTHIAKNKNKYID